MKELDSRWAWSRVEAMADGSLPRRDARRMRAACARDPELRLAVERARALRGALRRVGRTPVPLVLYYRLLRAMPSSFDASTRRAMGSWASASAAAAAAASVLAAVVIVSMQSGPRVETPVHAAPQQAALRDFELAMAYLHKSYEITGTQLRRAMQRELREAFGAHAENGADEPRENGG